MCYTVAKTFVLTYSQLANARAGQSVWLIWRRGHLNTQEVFETILWSRIIRVYFKLRTYFTIPMYEFWILQNGIEFVWLAKWINENLIIDGEAYLYFNQYLHRKKFLYWLLWLSRNKVDMLFKLDQKSTICIHQWPKDNGSIGICVANYLGSILLGQSTLGRSGPVGSASFGLATMLYLPNDR